MPSARRFVTRRSLTVLACVAVVGFSSAGCATQATAAAEVGDLSISEALIFDRTSAVVQQVVAAGNPTPDASTLAELNRRQATSAIRSELLQLAATDAGIVITDEQAHDSVSAPNGKGYLVNVASFKNGVGYGKWTHIDGWSESVVEYIRELEANVN